MEAQYRVYLAALQVWIKFTMSEPFIVNLNNDVYITSLIGEHCCIVYVYNGSQFSVWSNFSARLIMPRYTSFNETQQCQCRPPPSWQPPSSPRCDRLDIQKRYETHHHACNSDPFLRELWYIRNCCTCKLDVFFGNIPKVFDIKRKLSTPGSDFHWQLFALSTQGAGCKMTTYRIPLS